MREHSKILVVEDEADLNRLICFNLETSHFRAFGVTTGAEGLAAAAETIPDLIILDLMLPDISGKTVCRMLKANKETNQIPVIMLTACSSETDRVVGFELGATDYVTKPFSVRELVLRVKAVLRSFNRIPTEPSVCHGSINMNLDSHRVWIEDQEVHLTLSEFSLLKTMLQEPETVFTRNQLLRAVWGAGVTVMDRTVDVHIKRLRQKLGECSNQVKTIRGVGYKLTHAATNRRPREKGYNVRISSK